MEPLSDRRCRLIAGILISLLAGVAPSAYAQIVVSRSLIGSGGAIHAGSEVIVFSTVGQPFVGATDASRSGFWAAAADQFTATSIDDEPDELPREVAIADIYPNPFREMATIRFTLPEPAAVSLSIHDVLGREVAILVDEVRQPGSYAVTFAPGTLASGLYFCRLRSEGKIVARTMTHLR